MKYASPRHRLRANSTVTPGHRAPDGSSCWHWDGSYKQCRSGPRPFIFVRLEGKPRRITVARFIVQYVHKQRWTRKHVGAHSCHHDWCSNPDHVQRDTQKGNVRACVAAGRHVSGFDKARYRKHGVIVRKELDTTLAY